MTTQTIDHPPTTAPLYPSELPAPEDVVLLWQKYGFVPDRDGWFVATDDSTGTTSVCPVALLVYDRTGQLPSDDFSDDQYSAILGLPWDLIEAVYSAYDDYERDRIPFRESATERDRAQAWGSRVAALVFG